MRIETEGSNGIVYVMGVNLVEISLLYEDEESFMNIMRTIAIKRILSGQHILGAYILENMETLRWKFRRAYDEYYGK